MRPVTWIAAGLSWIALAFGGVAHAQPARDGGAPETVTGADAAPTSQLGDAPAAPAQAAPPQGDVESTSASGAEAIAALRRELDELDRVLRGELPESSTLDALLGIDLRAEAAVSARAAELETRLRDRDRQRAGDAATPTERERLEHPLDERRLAVMRLPREARVTIAEAGDAIERARREREAARDESRRAERQAREAEAARRRALDAAEGARTEAARRLANELARVETARRDQANLRHALAEQRVALNEAAAASERADAALLDRARTAPPRSFEASATYDDLVVALRGAQEELRAALDEAGERPSIPVYAAPDDLAEEPSLRAERNDLLERATGTEKASVALAAEIDLLRRDRVRAASIRTRTLDDARLVLLDRLPPEKRDRVLGMGPEGLEQLRREIDHLRLRWRWYAFDRGDPAQVFASLRRSPARAASAVASVLWLFGLIVIGVWATRRTAAVLRRASTAIARNVRARWFVRHAVGFLAAVESLATPVGIFVVVSLAPRAIGTWISVPEIALAYALARAYALYRLTLAIAYHLIAWLSSGEDARLAEPQRVKLLRSLRVVGRYALFIAVVLTISATILGQGYLYRLVRDFAWLGAVPIGVLLVRWWRDDIAEGFLHLRPGGTLAVAVRRTRRRWYGFFVAVAALGALAFLGAGRLVGRFVLGFEQTRRALAYLFRRRLERHAQSKETSQGDTLDDALVEALTLAPTDRAELLVDRATGQDEIARDHAAWAKGGGAYSTLLRGDSGCGKTTWLRQAIARFEGPSGSTSLVCVPERFETPLEALRWLADALGLTDGPATTPETLAAQLLSGPKRVVALDDAHLFFERGARGFSTWDAMVELIERTSRHVFWVVSVAQQPYEFLSWARRDETPFRKVLSLRRWSDAEIADLLRVRMVAAGYETRYDDLVVDEGLSGVEARAQILRTEKEYARLVWDFAEGSPRTALLAWRASLVPAGDRVVRVRLFRRPDAERIASLSFRQRLVLATVVWHEELSAADAARYLRLPDRACEDVLMHLGDLGVTERRGDRHRVSAGWLKPARSVLRRDHFIES
jgi:hypothetical protein